MSEFRFPYPHPPLTLLMGGDERCVQVRSSGVTGVGEGWWDMAADKESVSEFPIFCRAWVPSQRPLAAGNPFKPWGGMSSTYLVCLYFQLEL